MLQRDLPILDVAETRRTSPMTPGATVIVDPGFDLMAGFPWIRGKRAVETTFLDFVSCVIELLFVGNFGDLRGFCE
jgi:hypothetical protein